MCDAMNIVAASMGPIHVRMGLASERQADAVERARGRLGPCVRLTRTCAAEALTSSLVSLAASGSVLLEACLLDAPVVMTYRLDRATHWIGYHFLRIHEKLPHYALPNLIARERIIPEIVEREAVPERLAAEVCRIARDAGARRRMREGYRQVREALGSPGVTRAVARDILDIV